MKSKNTYKPKSSTSYKKGGKSSYKDKKIKRGDESHYFDPSDLTSLIAGIITGTATGTAIQEQQDYLTSITPNLGVNLTQTFQDVNMDGIPDGGFFGILDQFTPTGASDELSEFAADIPGLVKPIKPTSTEFAENLQDIQERRTGTTVTQMGKTGLPTGTKQILDAAAEGDIKTQSKVADLKMQEQKMEQERDKYIASLTGQTLTSISQQDLSAEQSEYGAATDVFGGVTSAYGDLMSSIIAGNVALAGTETMANAEMLAGLIEGVGGLLPDFNLFDIPPGEKGMKVQTYKKGAKVEDEKEYDKDGKDKDMLPAGDNNMTPGEFSHDKNPIDIVQKRPNGNDEKIGEMTGGEGIIAPKDMVEIEALLEKRDEKGVFKKMKVLIDRFNKVAEANAEKRSARESMKEQKAEMGAKMGYSINPKLKY